MYLNPRARLILAAIILACSAPSHGTVQGPEVALINGAVYYIPMDSMFGYDPPLEKLWEDPAAKLGLTVLGTAYWRGYIGFWEVNEDTLYLRALEAWHNKQTDEKVDMRAVFPERFKNGRVKADWFSGELEFYESAFFFLYGKSFGLPFSKGKLESPATARHIGVDPEDEDVWSVVKQRLGFGVSTPKQRRPGRSTEPQAPDIFLFDGIVYYLRAELSEQAFPVAQLLANPTDSAGLSAYPDGKVSGRLERGYQGIWEVQEGSLCMLALDGWLGGRKASLKALFPDRFADGRLRADWFSGNLDLITDENALLAAMAIQRDPPLDAPKITLQIENGRVVSVTEHNRVIDWTGRRGIAGSYINDEGIEGNRDVVAFADFESDDWWKDWSGGQRATVSVVSEDAERGFEPLSGKALRIKVSKGGHYGASLQYRFKDRTGSEPEEIYFRYYLRLGSDWDPARGGKLPGIGGTYGRAGWGGRPSNGRNGWSARGQFNGRKDGKTPIGFYCYHADMKGRYGSSWIWDKDGLGHLENNRWYCIEQRVRLNTPGKNDGVLEGWVDGKLAFRKTDVRMRDVPDLKIECIWINIYHGGTWSAESDDHLYIDNVVIAKRNIGPIEPPADDN